MLDLARKMLSVADDEGEHVGLRGQDLVRARLAAVLLDRRIFHVAFGADRSENAVRVGSDAGRDRIAERAGACVQHRAGKLVVLDQVGERRGEFGRLGAERRLQCGRIAVELRACFLETLELEREHQRMTRL